MNILKFAVAFICVVVFTLSALVIRNDRDNEHPLATVAFCLSMCLLVSIC